MGELERPVEPWIGDQTDELREWIDYANAIEDELARLQERVEELTEALEVYAAEDEWGCSVIVSGDNADGTEWEYEDELPYDCVFQYTPHIGQGQHGWKIAKAALAAAQEEQE